jgi:hypothetical protein
MWVTICSCLLRLYACVSTLLSALRHHEQVKEAKEEANAPETKTEEVNDFGNW